MTDFLNSEIVVTILDAVAYIVGTFFMFFVGKLVYGFVHRKIDIKSELVDKDNLAFSIAHVGYFVGLLIAIGGAIVGPSNGFANDMIDIVFYGVIAIVLLNISIIICDKVILYKFSVYKEIVEDRNEGTGVVEAAMAIASGLIIYGAITGEGYGLLDGAISVLVFWSVGQVLLVASTLVYNLTLSYNVIDEIEKDNVAVGVSFAGAIIAIANIIRYAISGDFEGWSSAFVLIAINFVIGLVLLPIVRFLADKILLPGRTITDELVNQDKPNVGVALIEAFAYIGGSVLLTWCI